MIFRYGLLLPAMLVALLLVGSASATISSPPPIPSPPYIPKSPEEDIIKVTTWGACGQVLVEIDFAAATPPTGQTLFILITSTQINPPTETIVTWDKFLGPAVQKYTFVIDVWTGETPSVAVYAWLGTVGTDRAPNSGFHQITSTSAVAPNQFYDPDGPVGGVVIPTSKLEIVAPFAALAGLIVTVSAVVAVKRRRD